MQQGKQHCRILQIRNNFGQKQSAKKEKSIYIGKKTIQMSNFHNPAEIDINLTGREQILIQKSGCLFFGGKTVIIFGKIFLTVLCTVKLFEKTRIFLLKKTLNETRNIAVPVFRKRKDLFFCATKRNNRLFVYPKSFLRRKTAFIQRASNRLTREQNFLIIDWHCYIIITIVTKK